MFFFFDITLKWNISFRRPPFTTAVMIGDSQLKTELQNNEHNDKMRYGVKTSDITHSEG